MAVDEAWISPLRYAQGHEFRMDFGPAGTLEVNQVWSHKASVFTAVLKWAYVAGRSHVMK